MQAIFERLKELYTVERKLTELSELSENYKYILYLPEHEIILYLGNFVGNKLNTITFEKDIIDFIDDEYMVNDVSFKKYYLYCSNYNILQNKTSFINLIKDCVTNFSENSKFTEETEYTKKNTFNEENYLHIQLGLDRFAHELYITHFILSHPYEYSNIYEIIEANRIFISWTHETSGVKNLIGETEELILPILV